MRFAIRDDDTSYFTMPKELEKAYGFLKSSPVSLSVVPYTVASHKNIIFPYGENKKERQYQIGENNELISYLKQGVQQGNYEILMHGITHEYKQINGDWISEMIWKDKEMLSKEISSGKIYLESLIQCDIKVFVAPNNHIDAKAISVLEDLEMDYSGIIQHKDRLINGKYIKNYLFRWGYRALKGVPYGGVLYFGGHKELIAYPIGNFERLKKEYKLCKEKGNPFVIYTHYWDVIKTTETSENLKRIISYILEDGAELVKLSDCYK